MSKGKLSVKVMEGDNYKCASCGGRIPKGARYWSIPTPMGGDRHEHLNCGEPVDSLPDPADESVDPPPYPADPADIGVDQNIEWSMPDVGRKSVFDFLTMNHRHNRG